MKWYTIIAFLVLSALVGYCFYPISAIIFASIYLYMGNFIASLFLTYIFWVVLVFLARYATLKQP